MERVYLTFIEVTVSAISGALQSLQDRGVRVFWFLSKMTSVF